MSEPTLIQSLGLMVVAAAALVLLTRRARIPSIVAYILAGLLLGPVAGVLHVDETLHTISEVGIALLLFVVGLELSLEKIRDVGRVAVVAGLVQIGTTLALGYALTRALGFAAVPALVLAIALTFSSTVVVVKLLDQKRELHALHGRIAVGVLLIQDLVVILVLTFLAGLGDGGALAPDALLRGLGRAFAGMAALLAVALLSARFVLPTLFRWIAPAADGLFIWSLSWCFLFVLLAEVLGLSPEIGAFLAGISLAQLPYSHGLRLRVHPLMNFFIAIFFVALGVEMELGAAVAHWGAALALGLFVLLSRVLIVAWTLTRLGYAARTAALSGLTLAQLSEFSFILMGLAGGAGLVDEGLLGLVALVGLGTIAISSYGVLFGDRLVDAAERAGLLRLLRERDGTGPRAEAAPQDHIVVVGMNSLGRSLVCELVERGEKVLAIDTDPRKLEGLPCPVLAGNVEYLSVLEEAHLADARLLVSALQIEDTNYLLAYRARQFGVPASIHAFDRSVVEQLREIGVNHLMLSKNQGLQRLARELRATGVLDL